MFAEKPVIFLMIFSLIFLVTCKEPEESSPQPTACFEVSTQAILIGEEIEFTSCSENAISHSWSFGDDSVSNEINPTHIYYEAGNFVANLRVDNENKFDQAAVLIKVYSEPEFTSGEAFEITDSSSSITGTIFSFDEYTIYQHGHCWSVNQNPTVEEDSKTKLGSINDAIEFTSELDSLLPSTKYFVRAYITTEFNTHYASEVEFMTL